MQLAWNGLANSISTLNPPAAPATIVIVLIVRAASPEHGCMRCRTLDVLRYLREHNREAEIIALAVLPRGWTDAWHVYNWPSMYKLGIDIINRALKDFAAQDDAVHYLDCGPAVTPGGQVRNGLSWLDVPHMRCPVTPL